MKRDFFTNLSIRSKLLYGYSAAFLIAILLGNLFLYSVVRSTIERNIESELNVSTMSIHNMVKTAVDTAIRSHLRGLGDAGLQIVQYHYGRYKAGEITEAEAKRQAAANLLHLTIGKTGYVYCVDSTGVIRVHPKETLIGKNLSENDFILAQKRRRHGYIEYDWANPGEEKRRAKALYMSYFGPWDWIVSASSYREEFRELISLEDFRSRILSITFGKTGYPYVMDTKGNLIIHPKLEGTNIFNSQDSSGRMFIQEICERKNGSIVYPWQNPGEQRPREKLVYFNYIPEMDWIVASSSYLEEFYAPLRIITLSTFATVFLIFLLVAAVSWRISTSITRPLHMIMHQFAQGAEGKFDERLNLVNDGEIGQLARYFNTFMEKLEESSRQLRKSEENYRELFNNAAEGIFRADIEGRFISVNPALAAMLGYSNPKKLMRDAGQVGKSLLTGGAANQNVLDLLQRHDTISGLEVHYLKRDGEKIWFAINGRVSRNADNRVEHIEGFVSNITTRKHSEEQQRKTQLELEQRVEERTAELSGWVRELERSNTESSYLREMSEMLQSCRNEEETMPVIKTYLQRFFPQDRVTLFHSDAGERRRFLSAIATGREVSGSVPELSREDCWALRQGKPHMALRHEPGIICPHFLGDNASFPKHASICVPLFAQEELTGLLMVECDAPIDSIDDPATGTPSKLEHKHRLAATIAEHLALALSNLKLRETLRLQTFQDPLTGLFNRRYFRQLVDREASRMQRLGTTHGIIMADLDHFKKINDTHGHEAGDEILRAFSELLLSNIRFGDVACRMGGEEFLLVLMDVGIDSARLKAQELCDAVRELTVRYEGKSIRFTVSMGVAGWPTHGNSIEAVIQSADAALYRAKQKGRDSVVVS